jgi:hypothetical protein
MVLKLLLLEEKAPIVTLKMEALNVPAVTVRVLPPVSNALPSVSVMPKPLTVTALNVLPAVLSVPVPVNDIVPVCV